jgi:DNA-binding response OmpR family regulator
MHNVIVVDDDPTNTTLIKLLLEMDGFAVLTSADINGAKVVTNETTDAYLIDCHLERGSSGLDLLKDIRSGRTAAAPDTVVIVTSGDYRREVDAEVAGADLFLLKPYPPDTLSKKLAELLNHRANHGE